MHNDSSYRQRFLDAPGLLAGRRDRRRLRQIGALAVLLVTLGVGVYNGVGGTVGPLLLSIGLAFAGLFAFGMAGLFVGVILTLLTIVLYNGIFNGSVSLVDLDFIDEIPLIFVAAGGVIGVFVSMGWKPMVGMIGWGFTLLILIDVIFRRPPDER